jgi:1,2-diacylglycerol 3-beta-galactosyltransferase
MLRLLRNHPADLVVSVHPLATTVPGRILHRLRPGKPFVTVVTDLATAHPFWYWRGADFTFVASEEARQRALRAGVPESKIAITGLPIDLRFAELPGQQEQMKREYGMPTDRSMLLLIGGGEGMGNLEGFARAIAGTGLPLSLMVIAGRNEKLRRRLTAIEWAIPTQITGFVRDMPRRMAAADLLITKAGPGTLSEGLAAGLPIFITGFIPGQEEGNVTWITESGAGRLTPNPDEVAIALHGYFDSKGPTAIYDDAQVAATRLARPDAALTIARHLMEMVEGPVSRE